MSAIWTCEDHGQDVVVVHYGGTNCPVCRAISDLESEKILLQSKIEELESEVDTLTDKVSDLEAGQ